MKIRKILSFILLLSGLFLIGLTVHVNADGPLAFAKDTVLESATILPGITWEKYTASSVNDEGKAGLQVVNVATFAPGTARVVAWSVVGAKGIQASNLQAVASNYENSHPNEKVVAAINGDYFAINGDKSMTNGCVADGAVLKEVSGSRFFTVGFKDDLSFIQTAKGGSIPVSDIYTMEIYDNTRYHVVRKTSIPGINVLPGEGEISYVTSLAGITGSYEAYKYEILSNMKLVDCAYVDGTIGERVTDSAYQGPMIVTKSLDYAELLIKGARIRIFKEVADSWSEYTNAIGVGGQTLKDGVIQTVEQIGDHGVDHVTSRHPRTSFGFKEDGSMCIMVIDGRQSDKQMDGVSERENALALSNEGCIQAFNLDGGGSSTFAVLKDGKLTVTNTPSDGGLRSDSDFLLMVVPKTSMEMELTPTEPKDGLYNVSGKTTIEALNGFSYETTEVYLNGVPTGQSADEFTLENLKVGKNNHISVYVSYKVGAATYTKCLYGKDIKVEGEFTSELIEPSNFRIEIEPTLDGFNAILKYDDPSNIISQITAHTNGGDRVVVRGINQALVKNYAGTKKSNMVVDFVYRYRLGLGNVVENSIELRFEYIPQFVYKFMADEEVLAEGIIGLDEVPTAPTNIPTKEGYDFVGWDPEVAPTSKDVTYNAIYELHQDNQGGGENPGGNNNGGNNNQNSSSGGMNCNFGGYVVSTMIACCGLLVLLLKRKH